VGYVDEDTGEVLVVLEHGDPLHLSRLGRYKTIREFAVGEPLRFEDRFGYWNKRIPLLREKLEKLLGAKLVLPDPELTWVVGDYDGFAQANTR
jgi:RNase H-fold protein (predicted Holliday junction resolvase)